MILTHPDFPRTLVDIDMQVELADLGVYIEKTWFNIALGGVSIKKTAEDIRRIGSGRVYIATDRGQKDMPSPTMEMKRFITGLLDEGVSEAQIRDLVQKVPERIVNTENQ